MNQDYSDPELLSDFFNEAREHLETIEPNLLELENNPQNLALLNEIFRPMHSLKGASGFLGLNKINRLAHKAENILDELRQGTMPVTAEVMDLILAATDALRTMVDNLETSGAEGEVETESIIERIAGQLAGESGPAVEPVSETFEAIPPRDWPEESPEPAPEPPPEAAASQPPVTENDMRADTEIFDPQPDPDFDASPYALTTVGEGHLSDFLEEAQDIIDSLNRCLLALEGDPEDKQELVNDLFRYFHNLKGNSGIIGFKELNSLTHEAETLLGRVRKAEMEITQDMVDVLLAVVDLIESLVEKVDPASGQVVPMDTSVQVQILRKATEEGRVIRPGGSGNAPAAPATPVEEAEKAEEPAPADNGAPDPDDVAVFIQAIRQQVENIDMALSLLGQNPDQTEYVDGLYRALDSIRNSCAYMNLEELRDYAERTAGLVDQGRRSGVGFDMMLDILGQEAEIIKDMASRAVEAMTGQPLVVEKRTAPPVAAKPAPRPASQPASQPVQESAPAKPVPAKPAPASVPTPARNEAAQASKVKTSSTIRVDHHKLDHLMNLIGELIINRNRYAMLARALEDQEEEVHVVAQQLSETTDSMARISDDLQDTIMNVRMVPVQTVFSRFPRLVRDLSRKSGKQMELILEGEDTELDKSVVEEIGDPLVHLVRNAVDHGLEGEEERIGQGKSPMGHVWLRAYHKGNSVAIEVEDDGKGIDPDKMRMVAARKGVITAEEADKLDDQEAIELIFAPGFSSAEKITDISGRGVGMDVVKTNIKNLKGSVHTMSEVGKGTKITLTLPLTLAIIDALMVQVAGETFAIPLDAVSETTKIRSSKLKDVNNRKAVTLRGEVLGIVELAELLDMPLNTEEREVLPIVIVQDNDRRVGLVVDRLLERQEIVIKPLGQYLSGFKLDGLSGATIMGDGSVVLILDPHEIYNLATAAGRPQIRGQERGSLAGAKAKALEG